MKARQKKLITAEHAEYAEVFLLSVRVVRGVRG